MRNRRGTAAAVESFDSETGRLHVVDVNYQDYGLPGERLVWETEPCREPLAPRALPLLADAVM